MAFIRKLSASGFSSVGNDADGKARGDHYSSEAFITLLRAHSWSPYASFVSTLRDLADVSFDSPTSDLKNLRSNLLSAARQPPPFDWDQRFPVGKLYVCLDWAPLLAPMMRLRRVLALRCDHVNAEHVGQYFEAIRELVEAVTEADVGDTLPVLYHRTNFEREFDLTWSDSAGTTTKKAFNDIYSTQASQAPPFDTCTLAPLR